MDADTLTISLCIPTMNRYDIFLSESIPKYLNNPHISEIIICDENGEDYNKIMQNFNDPKLKVFKNTSQLGCFKNKINVAKKASSQYICIFDSDNFASEDYFIAFKKYVKNNTLIDNSIYLTDFARPNFNYKWLIDKNITKDTLKDLWLYSKENNLGCSSIEVTLNTMNCILSRNFFEKIDILTDEPWCDDCYAYDSIYFCLYCMFEYDAKLIVVPDMEYDHRIHSGSHYTEMSQKSENFYNFLKHRYLDEKLY